MNVLPSAKGLFCVLIFSVRLFLSSVHFFFIRGGFFSSLLRICAAEREGDGTQLKDFPKSEGGSAAVFAGGAFF